MTISSAVRGSSRANCPSVAGVSPRPSPVQSIARQLLRAVYPVHKGGNDSRLAKSKHSFGKIGKVRVNSCHTVPPSAPEVREKRLRTAGKLASVLCYDADEAFAVKIPGKYRR